MNPTHDQLTAHALGEGSATEREALTAYLATHPDAAAEVAAITDTAALLSSELATEATAPGLDPQRRAALSGLPVLKPKRIRFPHAIVWPGLLAAGLAVVVMQSPETKTSSHLTENDQLGDLVPAPTVQKSVPPQLKAASELNRIDDKAERTLSALAATAPTAPASAPTAPAPGVTQPTTSMSAIARSEDATKRSKSLAHQEAGDFSVVRELDNPSEDGELQAPQSARGSRSGAGLTAAQSEHKKNRAFAAAADRQESGGVAGFVASDVDTSQREDATAPGEAYPEFAVAGWHRVSTAADDTNRWSTLGADVDTASYANVRRFLSNGQLPPADAVRTEEMLNSFHYSYTPPTSRSVPFAVLPEVGAAPWAPEHRLVRIALKGYELDPAARPPANLVFLVDVSGSMNQPTKLPLVQRALTLLAQNLRADDRVAIVTYAGDAGVRLEPTSVENLPRIQAAIDGLRAGGSTNGAGGIRMAYQLAKRDFIRGGVNRVVLCTDGDFNVGVSSRDDLEKLIASEARGNVFLTALGFGMGNYHDTTLQVLADKGNGNYSYIDTEAEARKQIVDGGTGMLVTIAKDVKLQVEFNPARVGAWRLLGYEKRHLEHQDFTDDKKDGGEIGAGHAMTALYEIIPTNRSSGDLPTPKYTAEPAAALAAAKVDATDELLTVNLRWKLPEGVTSTAIAVPVNDRPSERLRQSTPDFRFAAAVAEFAQSLRGVEGTWSLERALKTAQDSAGEDAGRREFIDLIRKAQQLRQ